MGLYLGSVVINVSDMERATKFWAAALNYAVRDGDAEFVVLADPMRRWASLSLQLWPERTDGPSRLHLDLYSGNQLAEVERLESLGAVRLPWDYPPGADYVVMADPEGNEFCVIASTIPQN